MSFLNIFRKVRQKTAVKDQRSTWTPANIGAVVNAQNVISSPHGGSWVYVTLTKGDQPGADSEAMCYKVTPDWNVPVLLSVNSAGKYVVEEIDPNRYNNFTSGNDGGVVNSHNVGVHTHGNPASAQGYDPVANSRLANGQVLFRGTDGPYTLYVTAFHYPDSTGADTYWPGGTINLVSYLTIGSGQQQWIKMGMDITNHVLTAVAGSAVGTPIPLDESDLAAVSFSPNLQLAGIIISYGVAIANQLQVIDCSFVKDSSSEGSSSLTVTDGTNTVTDVTKIDFTSGATVSSGGTGIADVDITGGGGGTASKRATCWADEFNVVSGSWAWGNDGNQDFYGYLQNADENGDELTSSIAVDTGTYSIYIKALTQNVRGKTDISIDGTVIGTLDWYAAGLNYNVVQSLTSISITTGYHKIAITINGKNASSSGYYFGFTKLWVAPATD